MRAARSRFRVLLVSAPEKFLARYFANRTLTGAAVTTRCEAAPLTRDGSLQPLRANAGVSW
jgi:hypothetical protein